VDKRKQLQEILRRLKKFYGPRPRTALEFSNPWELLVATILSAQTTDRHVNRVTKELFKKYKRPEDYARAPLEQLQADISSINFYRNKARSIRACAQMLMERFGGQVPRSMEELTALPGVARKTANIVLFNAYGLNEGVAVDTHVRRLAQRLGLTESDDPQRIEQDLMAIAPRKEWGNLAHLLILLGRDICKAKGPKHAHCVLRDICPSRDI
jgi:endonuclease-3